MHQAISFLKMIIKFQYLHSLLKDSIGKHYVCLAFQDVKDQPIEGAIHNVAEELVSWVAETVHIMFSFEKTVSKICP